MRGWLSKSAVGFQFGRLSRAHFGPLRSGPGGKIGCFGGSGRGICRRPKAETGQKSAETRPFFVIPSMATSVLPRASPMFKALFCISSGGHQLFNSGGTLEVSVDPATSRIIWGCPGGAAARRLGGLVRSFCVIPFMAARTPAENAPIEGIKFFPPTTRAWRAFSARKGVQNGGKMGVLAGVGFCAACNSPMPQK